MGLLERLLTNGVDREKSMSMADLAEITLKGEKAGSEIETRVKDLIIKIINQNPELLNLQFSVRNFPGELKIFDIIIVDKIHLIWEVVETLRNAGSPFIQNCSRYRSIYSRNQLEAIRVVLSEEGVNYLSPRFIDRIIVKIMEEIHDLIYK